MAIAKFTILASYKSESFCSLRLRLFPCTVGRLHNVIRTFAWHLIFYLKCTAGIYLHFRFFPLRCRFIHIAVHQVWKVASLIYSVHIQFGVLVWHKKPELEAHRTRIDSWGYNTTVHNQWLIYFGVVWLEQGKCLFLTWKKWSQFVKVLE